MEAVRDYLITKKTLQKQYHDKTHNVKPLPDLSQGQEVLFLSPADPNQYIEGTILAKAPQPRSYLLDLKEKHTAALDNTYVHYQIQSFQYHQRLNNKKQLFQDHQHHSTKVNHFRTTNV